MPYLIYTSHELLAENKNTRDRKKVPLIKNELDIRRHLQKQEEMPAYDVLL